MWDAIWWGCYGAPIPYSHNLEPPKLGERIDCETFEEVRIFHAPWVHGYVVKTYFSPITLNMQDYNLERGLVRLETRLQEAAFREGANAILGVATTVDLWDSPIAFQITGNPVNIYKYE